MALILPELYVLRHGETTWNVRARMQGRQDAPLTAKGHAQAKAMGATLAQALSGQVLPIFTSPLGRAVQTAQHVSQICGAPLHTDARLAEIDMGDWTGLTRAEIAQGWPQTMRCADELDWYGCIPDGEGLEGLRTRVRRFLHDLSGPCVIVTHGMSGWMLRAEALGVDPRALPQGQGVVFHLKDAQHRTLAPVKSV